MYPASFQGSFSQCHDGIRAFGSYHTRDVFRLCLYQSFRKSVRPFARHVLNIRRGRKYFLLDSCLFTLCHHWSVLFLFCQQIPDDSCCLVGQGNRRYLSAAPRCHSLNPFLHGIAFVLSGQGIASNYSCSLD